MRAYFFCLSVLVFSLAGLQAQTSGFTVPAGHPRLWWTTDRVNTAKAWYTNHPFTPRADDPFGNAFRYVLTGEASYARAAIDWLVAFRLPDGQVLPTAIGCDWCRWSGEDAMVVFDWCYGQMTPAERDTVTRLYNTYWHDVNQQDWGGVGMEGNNYYWGNLRNSLEWGIASFTHNTQAQSFLDEALLTRWQNSFMPYADHGSSRGGALDEGPGYGSTMLAYPIIPFVTLENLGRHILHESAFYQEAVACLLYATTPSAAIVDSSRYYDFFPYNEVEVDDIIHNRNYFGDFMLTMANQWETIPLGQYARRWVNQCKPGVTSFIQAVNLAGREKNFSGLPLDYYAPGLGHLYGRNRWDTTAMAFHIQMRNPTAEGHMHIDLGNFQLFRQGRWLTHETAGYGEMILGVEGAQVSLNGPDGHNTLFIGPPLGQSIAPLETRGMARGWQKGPPVVKRVESRPDYCYAAVDLSDCYRSNNYDLFENKYVGKVVREFLFIRPLEALIVFDRIQSVSTLMPAANVVKTAIIHCQSNPVIQDANHVLATMGNQALQITTLVPPAPAYLVTNEGGIGQYRLQVSTSGAAQSYLLNVLQGRNAGGTNLTTNLVEDATSFQVTLSHPSLGTAKIILLKGDSTSGGSFGYAATGTPSLLPLLGRIQGISVNDSGPVWEDLGSGIEGKAEGERVKAEGIQLEARPNPFNMQTTISYVVHRTSYIVKVQIFDCTGKLVVTLFNGPVNASQNKMIWNAQGLGSGVYVAKLTAGNAVLTKKLLLMK